MKDVEGRIEYRGELYRMIFNLNVMEQIQEEYKTIDRWAELTDGAGGEPNAKAVIFGFTAMINEGIDVDNEENGTNRKPLTLKQVGRLITEVGLIEATRAMNKTVVDSTKSAEKNA